MDELIFPELLELPEPRRSGGQPLLTVMAARHSTREYSPREIAQQLQSDLLWAALGINRPETGGRTAPSAKNWREIDIYLARADGAFRYEADRHCLHRLSAADLRSRTGMQDFVGAAPLNLVYVADLARIDSADAMERRFYCAADAAFVAQNVYLFCASEGLGCVVRGRIGRAELARELRLGPRQRVILAQTIGYPA